MWLLRNFVTSPFGRAFFAIHVSEVAAGSIGVPRARTKRNAYMLSAALAGLAGASTPISSAISGRRPSGCTARWRCW
ncbi:ABC transporter permease subunit [Azospirillum argentinense]|uniref:ABC transporter permease subunit n=1 Tax=Azospirillum argentinense TaxID=2970906 RepID=UPI00215058CC|nr:hypothetical protein [Azospirillum argentinense]